MPWRGGPLRVIVDGPVVEVASADGLLGGAIEPAERWECEAGACTAWVAGGS